MANPFEKKTQENPKVKESASALYHHLGHFLLVSRNSGKYNVDHLEKSREFTDRLLQISQNEALAKVLQEIKNTLDNIDANSKIDAALLDSIQELSEKARIERKY